MSEIKVSERNLLIGPFHHSTPKGITISFRHLTCHGGGGPLEYQGSSRRRRRRGEVPLFEGPRYGRQWQPASIARRKGRGGGVAGQEVSVGDSGGTGEGGVVVVIVDLEVGPGVLTTP